MLVQLVTALHGGGVKRVALVAATVMALVGALAQSGDAHQAERPGDTPVLTREHNHFMLDGVPISRLGLRVANALQSDEIMDRLVDSLDALKAAGFQSLAPTIQGGRYTEGGNSAFNGFKPDGSLDPDVARRLGRFLDETAARNMVPVVMLFYRGRDQELEDAHAVRAAVVNTIEFIRPWRHAWVHVINEPNHGGFDHELLTTSEGQIELYRLAKQTDPDRIVNVSHESGANDGFYVDTWGRLPQTEPPTDGDVNIEYTRGESYNSPGVYDEGDRPYRKVDDYRAQARRDAKKTYLLGGYWFWHAAWHQKADEPGWPRFEPGGEGTASDPGVGFIWDLDTRARWVHGSETLELADAQQVIYDLYALDSSRLHVKAGQVQRVYAFDDSRVRISGGEFAALYADATGEVVIHGRDFEAGNGLTLRDGVVEGTGTLTGQWLENGQRWSIEVVANGEAATIRAVSQQP